MAGGSGIALDHPRQLVPDRLELGHLGVDLGHPGAQQRLTVAAGTQTLVADGQQLGDLTQPQPDPLSALGEPQLLNRILLVLVAVTSPPMMRACPPMMRASKEAGTMGSIQVFLENGFEHDRVAVSAAGTERQENDVTTRYQVGLATVVELTVPEGEPSVVRVTLPDRGLRAEAEVDPNVTPYVRVNAADGSLTVQPESFPPMYA